MTMGDRVAVLKDGLLQQCDPPRRMYDHPNNVFVAGFIGSPAMNLTTLKVTDGGLQFGESVFPVERDVLSKAGDEVILGVRPEDLDVDDSGRGITVEVDLVEELGADAYVYGELPGSAATDKPFIARVDGRTPPKKGEQVHFIAKQDHVHLFDPESGERIN